jgi:hypothetical protein
MRQRSLVFVSSNSHVCCQCVGSHVSAACSGVWRIGLHSGGRGVSVAGPAHGGARPCCAARRLWTNRCKHANWKRALILLVVRAHATVRRRGASLGDRLDADPDRINERHRTDGLAHRRARTRRLRPHQDRQPAHVATMELAKPERRRGKRHAAGQGRIIDHPEITKRLIAKLNDALPVATRLTPELRDTLQRQNPGQAIPTQATITWISYAGDEGGIVCKLDLGLNVEGRLHAHHPPALQRPLAAGSRNRCISEAPRQTPPALPTIGTPHSATFTKTQPAVATTLTAVPELAPPCQ